MPYDPYALQTAAYQSPLYGMQPGNPYGGYQINPQPVQYAADPTSMFGAYASMINNQNTNQTNYDIAHGNANTQRALQNELLRYREGETTYRTGYEDQWDQRRNDTQRYGYDQQLMGQLGVADRDLQGRLGTAQLGLQGQLGSALMGMQGQLGSAQIGADANRYSTDAQRQTALAQLQNQMGIAQLQNSGDTQRAQIAADASTVPAYLRQDRFNTIMPVLTGVLGGLGFGGGGSSTPPPSAPPPPQPDPVLTQQPTTAQFGGANLPLPQNGAWSQANPNPAGLHNIPAPGSTQRGMFQTQEQQRLNEQRIMQLAAESGRGNDPNLVGSAAWRSQWDADTANRDARMAAIAEAGRAVPRMGPNVGAAGTLATVGVGPGEGARYSNEMRSRLQATGLFDGSDGTGVPMATGGGSPNTAMAYLNGPSSSGVQAAYGSQGTNAYGTGGGGPVAGGLPGGTGGPGMPGGGTAYGSGGDTTPTAGGLPGGTGGPGMPGGGSSYGAMLQGPSSPGVQSAYGGSGLRNIPTGMERAENPATNRWNAMQEQNRVAAEANGQTYTPQAMPTYTPPPPTPAPAPAVAASPTSNVNTGIGATTNSPPALGGGSNPFLSLIQGMPTGPLVNAQQQQQMLNSALAGNAASASQARNAAQGSMASRGWAPSSPALQRQNNLIDFQQMNANTQARTQIPLQVAQANGQYGLQTAQAAQQAQNQYLGALSGYYGAQSGFLSPILGALASFGS